MLRRKYLNEARILQNVDTKLKNSISSMISVLKAKGETTEFQKPPKKDSDDVLLQKYVIGLLKTGSECPETVNDIERIGTFKLYGLEYINRGGSISDIQSMYVDNGGTVDFEIKRDFPSFETADKEEYQSPEVPYQPQEDFIEELPEEPRQMRSNQDVIGFDNELDTISDRQEEEMPDELPIDRYINTMFKQVEEALVGDYVVWDNNKGLTLSSDRTDAICVCVASGNKFIDNKPRFMYLIQEPAQLNNPGNKGKYEDFFFRTRDNEDGHYDVIPGTKYHYQEGIKGLKYTQVLLGLENGAAIKAKAIANKCLSELDPSSEQVQSIAQYLKNNTYLPTLLELAEALEFLDDGKYWTSSVTNNGNSNIVYEINIKGDRFLKANLPDDVANVAAFVKI